MSGSCGIISVEYCELLDGGVEKKYYWTLMTSLPQSARKLQNNKMASSRFASVDEDDIAKLISEKHRLASQYDYFECIIKQLLDSAYA